MMLSIKKLLIFVLKLKLSMPLIRIKHIICLLFIASFSFVAAQEKDKALQKSNDFIYEANSQVNDNFIAAEKEYRKAISEKPTNAVGAYNLGNAYYKSGHYDEAMFRHLETIKNASSKSEKHKAYHNIGNTLMQQQLCKEAVEAYKNALRNNPSDDESRYNWALAKECAKQQGGGEDDKKDDEGEDKNKDDGEDEKDQEKDQGDNNEDENKDEGDQDNEDKNDGDEKEDDNGKPKDDEGDKKDGDPKNKNGKPKPQPGKLSPQQVKNLLEAMNNEDKKVRDKINAKKAKGVKVKTEKDW